jgi:hypothetical protein
MRVTQPRLYRLKFRLACAKADNQGDRYASSEIFHFLVLFLVMLRMFCYSIGHEILR